MNPLHRLLSRVRGSGDALLAAAALAVVVLLVAPLPPAVLDACLALNLVLAATVLLVALFARDALRFASFPTLLLLTTLFRLALSVSSTRLVLTRGDAGRVVAAFGKVVVQGNYVAGAVVFAILTLVQLLVVTKGAERVAEVAARFTLDALPGKQMSIDADLRAGAIDQPEARRRRRALERESQLYGAMDGALKFVKGDAVAGIAIVLVNVAGGLASGLLGGMPLAAAARRYALLAIGDGLAAQVPALLISVAAGVAVTRVAAEDEDGGSLGADIGRQLVQDPRALYAVAGLCALLAAAPGLPAAPFLALGLLAGGGARVLGRRDGAAADDARAPGAQPPPRVDAAAPDLVATPVLIELAPDLLRLDAAGGGGFVRDLLPALRQRLRVELGVELPPALVVEAPLGPGGWCLLVDEVPVASGSAPTDRLLARVDPAELALVGVPHERERDPETGAPAAVVAAELADRVRHLGEVVGPLERVACACAAALRRNAYALVGVQEVQAMLDALEAASPALVREASRQVPPSLLAEVLRRLLEEQVSIRPLRTILEALLEGAGAQRPAAALTESCRRALRRHLAHRYAPDGPLRALLLEPAAEVAVRDALHGDVAALDGDTARRLIGGVERGLAQAGDETPVLLTPAELRRPMRRLVAVRFPHVPVMSYEELPPELAVRPLGTVTLAA